MGPLSLFNTGEVPVERRDVPAMTNYHNAYTASQIANALHRSKRRIAKVMQHTPPTVVLERGALAWGLAALPPALLSQLDAEAKRRGCASVDLLLSQAAKPWEPPCVLSEIAPHCLEIATRLQRALAPMFPRMDDATLSESEFEALG